MAPLVNAKEWFKKKSNKKKKGSGAVSTTPTTASSSTKHTSASSDQYPLISTIPNPPARKVAPETTYVPRTRYVSKDQQTHGPATSASASVPYLPYSPPAAKPGPSSASFDPRLGSYISLPSQFQSNIDPPRGGGTGGRDTSPQHSQQQLTTYQPQPPVQPLLIQKQAPTTQQMSPPQQQQLHLKPQKQPELNNKDSDKTLCHLEFLHDDLRHDTGSTAFEQHAAKLFKSFSKFKSSADALRDSETVAQEYARTIKALWQMVEDEELSQRMADATPEEREQIIVHHHTSRELPFHGFDMARSPSRAQSHQERPSSRQHCTPSRLSNRSCQESSRSEGTQYQRRRAGGQPTFRHRDSYYLPYNSQHHHHPRLSCIRETGFQQQLEEDEEEARRLYPCPPAPRSSFHDTRPSSEVQSYDQVPRGSAAVGDGRYVEEFSDTSSCEDVQDAAVSSTLVSETVHQSARELQKRDHYTISERLAMEEDWRMQARLLKSVLEEEQRDALRAVRLRELQELQEMEEMQAQEDREEAKEQQYYYLAGDPSGREGGHFLEYESVGIILPELDEDYENDDDDEAGGDNDETVEFRNQFRFAEDDDDDDDLDLERIKQEHDILGLQRYGSFRSHSGADGNMAEEQFEQAQPESAVIGLAQRLAIRESTKMMHLTPRNRALRQGACIDSCDSLIINDLEMMPAAQLTVDPLRR
ncbi:hypothetical protein BG011_004846 [Mortierella polycephala]|uniref:Uncharacterized protein n=1 Tax=Mortierella polycephala TaxID=41804 RepID=A0A9P6PXL3_9FUNG|nr:hypothetical protein BG011_004846 [Mortierella polycephala]